MMWDQVLMALVEVVSTDQVLRDIYGDKMRLASSGKLEVPHLEWSFIGDTETELFTPCVFQFDQWHEDPAKVVLSERRLRVLFHTQLPAEFGGLVMWCEYVDGEVLAMPNRDGFSGRAVRFRFTPLRSVYALPTITRTP